MSLYQPAVSGDSGHEAGKQQRSSRAFANLDIHGKAKRQTERDKILSKTIQVDSSRVEVAQGNEIETAADVGSPVRVKIAIAAPPADRVQIYG